MYKIVPIKLHFVIDKDIVIFLTEKYSGTDIIESHKMSDSCLAM